VERAINELFEGFTYSIIKCLHVDYESTRKESFMDLQVGVLTTCCIMKPLSVESQKC
jgi:hypothetical protein